LCFDSPTRYLLIFDIVSTDAWNEAHAKLVCLYLTPRMIVHGNFYPTQTSESNFKL